MTLAGPYEKPKRFDQIIMNLTSGDLGILLGVSRMGVTGLKKTRVVNLLDLFEERGERMDSVI